MIPELPPKAGYVEVEIDGVRQYQKVTNPDEEKAQALQDSINASMMLEIAKLKAGVTE